MSNQIEITINIEGKGLPATVEFNVEPAIEPVLNLAPEDCDPGCGEEWEIYTLYIDDNEADFLIKPLFNELVTLINAEIENA